jgi:GNAT superfamily N-acetyltransferase
MSDTAVSLSVRPARIEEAAAVAGAVRELLLELGGTPAALSALEQATRELLEDDAAGAVLVAYDGDEIVGVLAASYQLAIHIPGRYALIQDLWVEADRRGAKIGQELLSALFAIVRERGLSRVEVGLPAERFARLGSTKAFYLANGFTHLGARMRQELR